MAKAMDVTKTASKKPAKVTAPAPEPIPETLPEIPAAEPVRWPLWLRLGGSVVVLAVLIAGSFELVYAGKIMPGVTADGVNVGGMSQTSAEKKLADATASYVGGALPITYGNTTLRIPIHSLSTSYDTAQAAKLAYQYGRTGSLWQQIKSQLRTVLGRPTGFAAYSFDDNKLTPYVEQVSDDVATPVSDATLSFADNQATVTPAKTGGRLDIGRLAAQVSAALASTSADAIAAPVYQLAPVVDTATLTADASQANSYLAGPLTLSYDNQTKTVDQATIISWIKLHYRLPSHFMDSLNLADLSPGPTALTFGLDQSDITAYVAALAKTTDQAAQNAGLAMQNGQLTVVQPSKTGIKLDQAAAVSSINNALTKGADGREVALSLQTTKAAVNEDNLDQLGIKDQLSEGETYFPGSPSTRLTNVRAGAAKFNGVLLAPGEEFSFGKLLGEVDASTGYVPELVILGDHEEKQYGGGLCQVSTTAFRAALLAGLPINERVNHAFAISYYTWPYGVPGVDATIYYPQVDFKFTNDTGHYILIQTTMSGVDLKFDFYGTKTKSGVIRGPQFVSGSNDATQPSHTVFYRDVLDLNGNVIKTDKFDTYYKPSTDFPITTQFN